MLEEDRSYQEIQVDNIKLKEQIIKLEKENKTLKSCNKYLKKSDQKRICRIVKIVNLAAYLVEEIERRDEFDMCDEIKALIDSDEFIALKHFLDTEAIR